MIDLVGCDAGPEADAARLIKQSMLRAWPWIEDDPYSYIFLIPNVQCHGENPRDIDLVILGSMASRQAVFEPTIQLRLIDGTSVEADVVHVRTICIALEIKDHDPRYVRFFGTKVEVKYHQADDRDLWHSASQQSEKQRYSVRNYLARHVPREQIPHVTNLIWLRNVPRDMLPPGPHNVVPSTLTWTTLLNAVAANSRLFREGPGITLACSRPNASFSFADACKLLSLRLEPTPLDRRRMDKIANAQFKEAWLKDLGKRQIVFEGRGGTGKTVILLGLAWRLQKRDHARVLLLTYNRALVADLQRLLVLMGLSDDYGHPYVEVQTIHSFIYDILDQIDLLNPVEGDFLESYDEYRTQLLALLRGGALTMTDLADITKESPERFAWDYVFVDEGQDWSEEERDILHTLYASDRFVIADGSDQLVRSESNCDWAGRPSAVSTRRHQLSRGLRMKANLARFANALADELGLATWSIEANSDAIGGKVVIVQGDYSNARNLHSDLVSESRVAGNHPVDLLTCVPPGMTQCCGLGRHALVTEHLKNWGYQVWDGVASDVRRHYPTSIEQLRVVQYDSCRGLEGWTVFNLAVDELYAYKTAAWCGPANSGGAAVDEDLLRHRYAARWVMIPCTRAIDTLVLNVASPTSYLGGILRLVYNRCADFVEWIEV